MDEVRQLFKGCGVQPLPIRLASWRSRYAAHGVAESNALPEEVGRLGLGIFPSLMRRWLTKPRQGQLLMNRAPAKQKRTTANANVVRVGESRERISPKGADSTAEPASPSESTQGDSDTKGGLVDPGRLDQTAHQPQGPGGAAKGLNGAVQGSRCQPRIRPFWVLGRCRPRLR
jgi:hypothetical protein